MSLRKPTDRAAAFAHWRRRVAGEQLQVSADDIRCGLYRGKRKGQHVGVQIDLVQNIDPDTGELLSEESFVAFVGPDAFYDQAYVAEIWLRCCGAPVSEAEFKRLSRMPAVSDLSRGVIV